MNIILDLIRKLLIFEKEPQQIGLSQIKKMTIKNTKEATIKNKDIKLSDLMKRVS